MKLSMACSRISLLAQLLLALAAVVVVVADEAPLQCPGEGSSSLSLDSSNLKSNFYLGVFLVEQAPSASGCLEKAMAAQCEGVHTEFFIYSLTGFTDPHNSNHGNCAFGTACIGMKAGDSPAVVGRVPRAQCNSEKKSTLNVETQQARPLPCPVDMTRQKLMIDDGNFHELSEQGLVTIVRAETSRECRRRAKEATCSHDMPSGFFVFNSQGFSDPSGFDMGECALFPSCFGLEEGDVAVTVGNVKLSEQCVKPSLRDSKRRKARGAKPLRGRAYE